MLSLGTEVLMAHSKKKKSCFTLEANCHERRCRDKAAIINTSIEVKSELRYILEKALSEVARHIFKY